MSQLPDLTRVNGFAYGENDLILDPGAPLTSARRLLADRYTIDGSQLLHHHRGSYYGWTGTYYAEIEEQFVNSDIYHFLEYAKQRGGKVGLKRFEPNRSRVGEVLSAMRAAAYLSDRLHPPLWLTDAPDLDPRDIVACSNGLLHLPTKDLMPLTPYFFTLNAIDYPFIPNAPVPWAWLEFLESLWHADQESIATLQEIFGYCLVADTSQQKAFMLIGPKRSGKGTIARVLQGTIGAHNSVSPTLTGLGSNFGTAPLIGKRLAIISDARISGKTDTAIVAERLLAITGEDSITLDRKNRDAWTGKLDTRFLLISNELPRIGDASGALASRFIVLMLTESFFGREDHSLTMRLLAERPGILNWAIEGYERLVARGYFLQPETARDAIRDLEDLGSPIGAFVRDHCTVAPGKSVEMSLLYGRWRQWCEDQGRGMPGTLQSFGRDLRAAVPGLKSSQPRDAEGARLRVYEGIGLA